MSAEAGELVIYQRSEGRWAWCYREGDGGFELHSNQDHASREEAVAEARQAYPDTSLATVVGRYPEETEEASEPSR